MSRTADRATLDVADVMQIRKRLLQDASSTPRLGLLEPLDRGAPEFAVARQDTALGTSTSDPPPSVRSSRSGLVIR